MIIPRTTPRVLMPVPRFEWREPSPAQPKDEFGNQNRTRFRLEYWRRDGGLLEQHWYDDRDEFDDALWRIIENPLAPDVVPMFAVVTTITAPVGSLQTYNKPTDWDNANNYVGSLGGGGAGGAANKAASVAAQATGGGGAGYGLKNNITITGSTNYWIASGAAQATRTTTGAFNGTAGANSFFGAAAIGSAPSVGYGGAGGTAQNANNVALAAVAGGSGVGDAVHVGGGAGSILADDLGRMASGGGGSAGPSGNGAASPNVTLDGAYGGHGGAGDNGNGAAGTGPAGTGATSGNGTDGATPTYYNGAGGGGGGGGCTQSGSNVGTAGHGGFYGGGGGGVASGTTTAPNSLGITNGAGRQGIIWVTYTPLVLPTGKMLLMFN